MDRLETTVAVTLSDDLLRVLRREADSLGLPLEWVVASLIVDTFEPTLTPPGGLAA